MENIIVFETDIKHMPIWIVGWLVGWVLICSNCMFADKRVSVSMSGYNSIVCCWGFF